MAFIGLMESRQQLWVLEPAAASDDGRWQGRSIWRMVLVSAPTPALARLTAEEWALADEDAAYVGNETPSPRAGFTDEKLYHVRPAPKGFGAGRSGARRSNEVLLARRAA